MTKYFCCCFPTDSFPQRLWGVSLEVAKVVYDVRLTFFLHGASKWKWIAVLPDWASEIRRRQKWWISPLFQIYLSEFIIFSPGILSCRVKAQHKRFLLSSPTKVGSVYQAFHYQCIFTNGHTFGTLLHFVSRWCQTVNHYSVILWALGTKQRWEKGFSRCL